MKNKYYLKNFRVFDEIGEYIEIAPITVLTGCNNSGKSSITKSWILLQDLIQQIINDINNGKFKSFEDYCINFTIGNHKLGSFESIINWKSQSKYFTIEYDADIYLIGRNMRVSLTFEPDQSTFQYLNDKNVTTGDTYAPRKSSSQSLFAKIAEVKITDDEWGVFYEYSRAKPSSPQSTFHFNDNYRNAIIDISRGFDYKNAMDEILNCQKADEAGFYYSSEFNSTDIETLKEHLHANVFNYIWTFFEQLRIKAPQIYINLCKQHKIDIVREPKSDKINWKKSRHTFFDEDYIYPMTFFSILDEVKKENIMDWVNQNIIEESKDRWFNCEKFKERIYYIFDKYIKSDFIKFSDFYLHYEKKAFESYSSDFAVDNSSLCQPYFFMGTACEESPFSSNHFEEEWDWTDISDSDFFYQMFDCLSGFGGWIDYSMINGPAISYPQKNIFLNIANSICLEALVSASFIYNAQFIEIDRSNTQRIYTFGNQGTTFNKTLETYINLPGTFIQKELNSSDYWGYKKKYTRGTFLNKWLKELSNFEKGILKLAPEGVGIYVYLKQKINRKTHTLSLADVGYGMTPLISMLIRIELMICEYTQRPGEIGMMCIEEPESNLHPNLQAKLAEMFVDAIVNYRINFMIETHSEYIIRKLQNLVATKKIKTEDISIHYFANSDPKQRVDGEPQVKHIKIKENGGLTAKFGTGFLDEATNLSTELFRM